MALLAKRRQWTLYLERKDDWVALRNKKRTTQYTIYIDKNGAKLCLVLASPVHTRIRDLSSFYKLNGDYSSNPQCVNSTHSGGIPRSTLFLFISICVSVAINSC